MSSLLMNCDLFSIMVDVVIFEVKVDRYFFIEFIILS